MIIVKKEGANYDVYRYNELVAIQRKNEDGVYHDTILNLIEIETTIRLFWQNTKRNIKTDCFISDNLIYRDNMYIIPYFSFSYPI